MISKFFMPQVSIMGENSLKESMDYIKNLGFKYALIVTDKPLNELGVVKKITDMLDEVEIKNIVYDETKPNPTIKNVNDGLEILEKEKCDFIISLGGGSPHDCAKGIALLATNGGEVKDYEGLDKSKKPQLPLVAINTTAGTAAEMTRFAVITDEDRHIKMGLVDKNLTPIISVNDPVLMAGMPKSLTAATGMDALTHAVEAYVSTDASVVTDTCAIKAIELIVENLKEAVKDGSNMKAREGMAYAEYLAGMAFNSASLGYVHAMAHQLGGFYNLPHGVCNAILLPHVQEFNKKVAASRLKYIAGLFGVDTSKMSDLEGADACINEIKKLSKEVGIPSGLKEVGAKEEDFKTLATNALKDTCSLTNPRQGTIEEVIEIYRSAM